MQRDTFLGALKRRWWVVAAAFLIGIVAGAAPSPSKARDVAQAYEATHTLLLTSNDPSGAIISDTLNLSEVELYASAGEVPRRVAAELGIANAAQLSLQVDTELDGSNGSLAISTRQSTAARAEDIVDAFAKELSDFIAVRQDEVREQRLNAATSRVVELKAKVTELAAKLAQSPTDPLVQAELDAATRQYGTAFETAELLSGEPRTITLVTLQPAEAVAVQTEGFQAPRSRTSRGLLLGVVGAILGGGLVLLLNLVDPRIRRRSQAEAIFGTRAQLTIPSSMRLGERTIWVRRDRNDAIGNAYRALRSVLALAHHDRADTSRAPITLVLSSGPGDGKTTATVNLAAAFAETGARTVAVNTDFRRPSLSGALEALGGAVHAAEAPVRLPIVISQAVPELRVYDERAVDTEAVPGELARRVTRNLANLTEMYDEVLLDSPPISLAAEVFEFLPVADTIVVLVRLGHTRLETATKAAETLRALGIDDFLLVIVGGASQEDGAYYYGTGGTASAAQRGRDFAIERLRRLRSAPGPDDTARSVD
jgi:Mrp family chromosome partitioning ATPase